MANRKNKIKKLSKEKRKLKYVDIAANMRKIKKERRISDGVSMRDQKSGQDALGTVETRPILTELQNICEVQERDIQLSTSRIHMEKQNEKKRKQLKRFSVKESTALEEDINFSSGGEERRITDIFYFIEELKIMAQHNKAFGCGLQNMNFVSESRVGLLSKLKFKCNMCNVILFANTCDPNPKNTLDVNKAAVSGITTSGIGLSQFSELLSALNIPTMSQKIYDTQNTIVGNEWEKISTQAMEAAAERERQAAIKEGRVKDGIAIIDVIVDGCWSKRSYRTNYSALSGAAVIIGKKFGEVLYLGVKNKYCCICTRAENKNLLPEEHLCYKNYTGPSTGMESEIILEGFKRSIDMYNIIYGRMIADGDSSTYSKIIEARPYPNHTVEKIECRNHLLRNLCSKLSALQKDTKYAVAMRKLITTQRILAIRKAICLAIKENKNSDGELSNKINNLYVDISNSYHHAFGNHVNCKSYYCSSEKRSENLVNIMKTSTIWNKIQFLIGIVAANSRSLINDVDSNRAEIFNSKIAKYVGGKRVNYSLRQNYKIRCAAAVVSFNTKKPLYILQKSILDRSPKCKAKLLEEKRNQKNVMCKKYLRKKKLFSSSTTVNDDKNYGENCTKPDLPEDQLQNLKDSFLNNLKKTEEQRRAIERTTVLQRDSSEWLELRRQMITASNFGKIINRRITTVSSILKSLLYKNDFLYVQSVRHGIDNERVAIKQLSVQLGIEIQPCGLFIDKDIPFLGATPDGLIGDDKIVEVKCPLSVYKAASLEDAVRSKKLSFYKIANGELIINKKHAWYIQVQGQLHVTNRRLCIFAIWSGENRPIKVEIIEKDDEFWNKVMVEKLKTFYIDYVLPELLDPRHTRNMPFRGPASVVTCRPRKRKSSTDPICTPENNSGTSKKHKPNTLCDIHELQIKFQVRW